MVQIIDAAAFQRMVIHAHAAINAQKQLINDLNVFPVPDGDTGTNMTLSIRAASKEMKKNQKIEICGMHKGTWIRVEGEVTEDTRREARVAMMDDNKTVLSSMYTVDDNLMTVFRFEHGTATIYSFTAEPKVIEL